MKWSPDDFTVGETVWVRIFRRYTFDIIAEGYATIESVDMPNTIGIYIEGRGPKWAHSEEDEVRKLTKLEKLIMEL